MFVADFGRFWVQKGMEQTVWKKLNRWKSVRFCCQSFLFLSIQSFFGHVLTNRWKVPNEKFNQVEFEVVLVETDCCVDPRSVGGREAGGRNWEAPTVATPPSSRATDGGNPPLSTWTHLHSLPSPDSTAPTPESTDLFNISSSTWNSPSIVYTWLTWHDISSKLIWDFVFGLVNILKLGRSPKKHVFLGNLSQIWVCGVADSQTSQNP